MSFKTIVVLESEWESRDPRSYSVWPMISECAKVCELESYYKFFLDGPSLTHWVRMFNEANLQKPVLLYVAAHGKSNRIVGISKSIEFELIRQALTQAENITHVYFACCHFGSDENLSKLLESAPQLKWAAGFGVSVNWIDSLAFDLLFFSCLAKRQYERKGIHIRKLVTELLNNCPGLASQLEFRFKIRQGVLIRDICILPQKEGQ